MVDVDDRLAKLLSERDVAGFCVRWKVRELALFGSVLRDDFSPGSDVAVIGFSEPDE